MGEWNPFLSRVVLTAFHISYSEKPFIPAMCKMFFCMLPLLHVQSVRMSRLHGLALEREELFAWLPQKSSIRWFELLFFRETLQCASIRAHGHVCCSSLPLRKAREKRSSSKSIHSFQPRFLGWASGDGGKQEERKRINKQSRFGSLQHVERNLIVAFCFIVLPPFVLRIYL